MTSSDELISRARTSLTDEGDRIPRRGLAIVTCMDARVDPLPVLSLRPGDAHVVRNAGGVVTDDVLRSLIVSQRDLRTTAVDVMMHTDCGMLNLDEAALQAAIAADAGRRMPFEFNSFTDLEAELKRGVGILRSTMALPHRGKIRGLVYDVASRRVRVLVQ